MSETTEPKRRGRPPKQPQDVAPPTPVWIHPDSLWNEYGGQPPMFAHGSQDQAPTEGAVSVATDAAAVSVDVGVRVAVGTD